MTKLFRLSAAVLSVAAVAAVTAGCGSGSGKSGGDPTITDGAPITATKSAKDLVLTAGELPSGVQSVPITDAQLKSQIDQLGGAASTMQATPAECGSKTAIVDATAKLDVSKLGMVAGSSGTSIVAESVIADKPDIAKLRSAFTGTCKKMTAQLTTQGQAVSTTLTRTVLDAPSTKAKDLLVVEQKSSSSVAGTTVEQTSYQAYAQVGAYAVTVGVTALSGTPDKGLFDSMVTKSIDKVAAG